MSGMGGLAERGIMLYLGNYLTDQGNIQFLMDRAKGDPKMRVINIPILENGKPTWESRYCLTDAEAEKTGKQSIEELQRKFGSYRFSYEFMNIPVDESTSEFNKKHRHYVTMNDVRQLNTVCYITIDSAVRESETADFTGVTVNFVSEQNKWYIYTYHEKLNTMKLIDMIFEVWEQYRPEAIGLEETTFTMAIKPFIDEEMRKRKKFITFKMLKHGGTNKITRIRGLIPLWESDSIFLIGDNLDLINEMKAFPNGANDDILDSLAHQLKFAERPMPLYDEFYQTNKQEVNEAR